MVFHKDIIALTRENTAFRKEVATASYSQIVLMNIEPGDEIGQEIHKVDQVLFFVDGDGQAIINSRIFSVGPNTIVLVPAGTQHNFKNTGLVPLKLFTIYAPAQHKPGTLEQHKGKEY